MDLTAPRNPAPPDGAPLAVETQLIGRSARLTVRGELDVATAGIFEAALCCVWSRGVDGVEIDLRGLTFIGSAGVATLLEASSRARDAGCTLTLVRGPRPVQRIFELTGIEGRFTFRAVSARSGSLRLVR